MTEENENLVTLQDEDGNDVVFEHLMTISYEGAEYILLEATEDMEDCKQGESIILRIDEDENGDEVYATLEDEAEYQAVFDKCMKAIEEEDEESDDGGEDDDKE